MTSLGEDNEELRDTIRDLETDLKSVTADLEASEEEATTLRAKVEELETEVNAYRNGLEEIEAITRKLV